MILSIDVGIRNLAMCMLDETSNLIVQWDVSGVPPEHKVDFKSRYDSYRETTR